VSSVSNYFGGLTHCSTELKFLLVLPLTLCPASEICLRVDIICQAAGFGIRFPREGEVGGSFVVVVVPVVCIIHFHV